MLVADCDPFFLFYTLDTGARGSLSLKLRLIDSCITQIATTMEQLMGGETYGDRRGAAFGLAGMVKGLGISALKAPNPNPETRYPKRNRRTLGSPYGRNLARPENLNPVLGLGI